jgi:hypothetical protein
MIAAAKREPGYTVQGGPLWAFQNTATSEMHAHPLAHAQRFDYMYRYRTDGARFATKGCDVAIRA